MFELDIYLDRNSGYYWLRSPFSGVLYSMFVEIMVRHHESRGVVEAGEWSFTYHITRLEHSESYGAVYDRPLTTRRLEGIVSDYW